jgi:uncharacterized membrane protein YgcG
MRALTNRDIATGNQSTTANTTYSTTGSPTTFQIKNDVPDSPAPTCYVRAFASSCTDEQQAAVLNGTALVHNWIVVDANTTSLVNSTSGNSTSSGGRPGSSGNPASSSGSTGAGTGTSSGGAASSTAASGDGVEMEVQLSFIALILAIAVAVVL